MIRQRNQKTSLCFLFLAILFLLHPVVGTTAPPKKAKEPKLTFDQAVRATLDTQIEAWNRGDLVSFCEIYTPEATFLSPSGLTQGREEVLARYQKAYPTQEAMGTLALEIKEILPTPGPVARNAAPFAVSVAARWSLSYPDRETASGWTLLVMHHLGDRWFIAQDASMLAAE